MSSAFADVVPKPSELALSPHEAEAVIELAVVAALSDGPLSSREVELVREAGGRVRALVRRALTSARTMAADQPISPEGPYRSGALPVDDTAEHTPLPLEDLDVVLARVDAAGWRDRMWTVSEAIDREIARQLAYQLAAIIVLHDVFTDPEELELLKKLRTALHLDRETADGLLASAAMRRPPRGA